MRFNHLLKFRDQSYSYHPYGSVKSKQNNDVTSTTAYNAEHRLSKARASIDKRGSEDEEIAYYHTDLNRSRKNLTMQTVKYCGNVAVSYGVNDFRKLSKNQ
jgi:hypothetical protein